MPHFVFVQPAYTGDGWPEDASKPNRRAQMPRDHPEVLSYRTDRDRASKTRWAAVARELPLSEYIRLRMDEVVDRDLGLDTKHREQDE